MATAIPSAFRVPAGSAYYAQRGQNARSAPKAVAASLQGRGEGVLMAAQGPTPQGSVGGPSTSYQSYGGYASPEAQQLAQQQSAILGQLPGRLGTIYNSANEATAQSGRGIDSTLRSWGVQQRQAQRGIDQKRIQNEASKRSGTQDILGMVGRGIRSGGVTLGNKNAANSSAAGEIARAYGDIGQREQFKVNNQYSLGNQGIDSEQRDLAEEQALYRNSVFQNSKEQIIGGIVQSAQAQLAELDNALRGASLPDRISIEGEKNKIRVAARNELAKFDTLLNDMIGSAKAITTDEARAQATRMAQQGIAPSKQFDYNAEAPMEWQGQAPAGGNLPIYTFKRGQEEQSPIVPQVV